jgi:hypothetical protein
MEEEAGRGAVASSHFIVELRDGDKLAYALCERILVVDGDEHDVAGVPRDVLERLFSSSPLRAVALPPSRHGGHFLSRTMRGQSGVNVNVNINP